MDATYPATYRDRHGEVATSIHNDGQMLTMVLRGIEFHGSSLVALEPPDSCDPSCLAAFTFEKLRWMLPSGEGVTEPQFTEPRDTYLSGFSIDSEMPIPVVVGNHVENGTLLVRLNRIYPPPQHGLKDVLLLELCLGEVRYRSSGYSGWYEDEMLELQKQLPEGTYMKACINCAFSDYSPGGHDFFGCLACFRDNKEAYLRVHGKHDLFRIWKTATEFVQETYLCPEFQRRVPGTGYRG